MLFERLVLALLQFHTITTLRTMDMPQKSHGMPRPETKMLDAILTDIIDMIIVRKK